MICVGFSCFFFFFSSRRRHTRCALVTGVQTCALPIFGRWREGAASEMASLAEVKDAAERRQILRALQVTEGQVMKAAELLGVSRTTLWEKIDRKSVV